MIAAIAFVLAGGFMGSDRADAGPVGTPDGLLMVEAAQTNADTTSIALDLPNVNQTIIVKKIQIWYDNGAGAGVAYAGVVTNNAAHTRHLWLGATMAAAAIGTAEFDDINYRITPSTAQSPGVRLFINAASSDSVSARVYYYFVSE